MYCGEEVGGGLVVASCDGAELLEAAVSERAFTSRSTLQRIEAGNANVGIGIYAAVLHALGLLDGLSGVADIRNDSVGQALSSADLPKHVHARRTAGPAATADVEVHIDLNGQTHPVGVARSNGVRGAETVLFEYTPAWLNGPGRLHPSPATIRTSWSGLISGRRRVRQPPFRCVSRCDGSRLAQNL